MSFLITIKHCGKCITSFPDCPCNTCAKDVIDDDGKVCCSLKKKKCEQPCPDYIDEREEECFGQQE